MLGASSPNDRATGSTFGETVTNLGHLHRRGSLADDPRADAGYDEYVGPVVDWDSLKRAACDIAERAYAPYSRYRVGAAALADDGRLVVGCNVENAAYGVTLCAECGLVSQLHATGGGRLTHFVCVNGADEVIMPCGRCRQLLWENGGAALEVLTPEGVQTMDQVLPQAFGPENLARRD
jgi:cytidine deaminase